LNIYSIFALLVLGCFAIYVLIIWSLERLALNYGEKKAATIIIVSFMFIPLIIAIILIISNYLFLTEY